MRLYELTGQYLQLLDMAGEVDDDTFADTLEAIEGEIEDKADNCAKVIKSIESDIAGIDTEIKRLQSMKSVRQNNVNRIKRGLESAMIALDKPKFKTELFSFGIQKNPPTVNIIDESAVPDKFWKVQEPTIDKVALKEYLKTSGSTAYATLQQTESLRIR